LDRKAYSLEFREEVMRNMPDIYKKDISEIEKEIVKLGEKGKIENKA
jgi:CII-binding regulator of phage lambda lysogenization HflD